jgi:hypothetical protein
MSGVIIREEKPDGVAAIQGRLLPGAAPSGAVVYPPPFAKFS